MACNFAPDFYLVKSLVRLSIPGQLIGSFKKLLLTMKNLCDLTLVDLVLVTYEANSLMDLIGMHMNRTLKQLSCVNLTTNHCSIHQIGMLYNLKVTSVCREICRTIHISHIYSTDIEDITTEYWWFNASGACRYEFNAFVYYSK